MVKINMIEKISYYLARKIYMCSEADVTCAVDEKNEDVQVLQYEVKSADNTRAKSLKVYMDTYQPAYAIKLSAKNFAFEDRKKIVPLYAALCI